MMSWPVALILITHLSISHSGNWILVWEDEFTGDNINNDLWNFEIGDGCPKLCGWGNEELQFYTSNKENAFVQDGRLIIQAIQQKVNHSEYTSVRMNTRGKGDWKYGRIEVRAKFPRGHGLLPQIWMLPTYERYGIWPSSGHIDLATMHNAESGRELVSTAIFGPSYKDTKTFIQFRKLQPNETEYSEEFYVYSLKWEKDNLQWFVNDKQTLNVSRKTVLVKDYLYPFNDHFYLVLSLGVGGNVVRQPIGTKFPQRFEIDYVRVYQKNS